MFKLNHLSRWHPEVALRYIPIVDAIKDLNLNEPQILEVGSGSLGIAPYLGLPITGLDADFSGPQFSLLKQVVGEATSLPFPDDSFDIVALVDVLEHISPGLRQKAISEALRCARKAVFLAFPEGHLALEQDRKLAALTPKRALRESEKTSRKTEFFNDHLTYPFPRTEEIRQMVEKIATEQRKKIEVAPDRNENLKLRELLMRGWLTENLIIDMVFRKLFLVLIPLFLKFNHNPTYRQIVKIYLK